MDRHDLHPSRCISQIGRPENRIYLSPQGNAVEDRVALHDMSEGLPVYMLFESACGYSLFLAEDIQNINYRVGYEDVENFIKHIDQAFTLVAFDRFESTEEALSEMSAVSERTVSDRLMNFLTLNLPKPREGDKYCFLLSVPDIDMINHIARTTKIFCTTHTIHIDIMRGLRQHIHRFIDMEPGVFEKARLNLARLYCLQRLDSAKAAV